MAARARRSGPRSDEVRKCRWICFRLWTLLVICRPSALAELLYAAEQFWGRRRCSAGRETFAEPADVGSGDGEYALAGPEAAAGGSPRRRRVPPSMARTYRSLTFASSPRGGSNGQDRGMTSTEAHEDLNSPDPAAASDSSNPAARQGSPWMVAPHRTAVVAGAVEDAVRRALAEDRAEDDVTTRWAVPDGTRAQARVVACQGGVIMRHGDPCRGVPAARRRRRHRARPGRRPRPRRAGPAHPGGTRTRDHHRRAYSSELPATHVRHRHRRRGLRAGGGRASGPDPGHPQNRSRTPSARQGRGRRRMGCATTGSTSQRWSCSRRTTSPRRAG